MSIFLPIIFLWKTNCRANFESFILPFRFVFLMKGMKSLLVRVIDGSSLVNKDLVSTSDPYACVWLSNAAGKAETRQQQTRTIDDCLDPKWEEEMEFAGVEGLEEAVLHVAVYDSDPCRADELLGEGQIPVAAFLASGGCSMQAIPLSPHGGSVRIEAREIPFPAVPKRIVVLFDGTWNGPEAGLSQTNVFKLFTALAGGLLCQEAMPRVKSLRSEQGALLQVAAYIHGVGDLSKWRKGTRLVEGATGLGLRDRVIAGYNFVRARHVPGDEVCVLGFSRGGYSAHALAELLCSQGLSLKQSAVEAYFANRHEHPPHLSRAQEPAAVSVAALACWDCVGALGTDAWWGDRADSYHYAPPRLHPGIQRAYHALAVDEGRETFLPHIWEMPSRPRKSFRQLLFPGCHSDVGGGYHETSLSDLTLVWMVRCLLLARSQQPLILLTPELQKAFLSRSSLFASSSSSAACTSAASPPFPSFTIPAAFISANLPSVDFTIAPDPAGAGHSELSLDKMVPRRFPASIKRHRAIARRKNAPAVPLICKGQPPILQPYHHHDYLVFELKDGCSITATNATPSTLATPVSSSSSTPSSSKP